MSIELLQDSLFQKVQLSSQSRAILILRLKSEKRKELMSKMNQCKEQDKKRARKEVNDNMMIRTTKTSRDTHLIDVEVKMKTKVNKKINNKRTIASKTDAGAIRESTMNTLLRNSKRKRVDSSSNNSNRKEEVKIDKARKPKNQKRNLNKNNKENKAKLTRKDL